MFYVVLSIWRFILGIGCGGIYPLAAVLSAECQEDDVQRWKRMAKTFSTQGFGFWLAPLVSWVCILLYGDMAWRIVLGTGCIPGILIIVLKCYYGVRRDVVVPNCCDCLQIPLLQQHVHSRIDHEDTKSEKEHFKEEETTHKPSLYHALAQEPNIIKKLLGTALIWFLFDILFYGNTLFQPIVLSNALGNGDDDDDDDDLIKVCRDSLILSSIALPGYIIGAYLIGNSKYQRPKYIQCRGFILMSLFYTLIGLFWNYWKEQSTTLLLLYGSTFFFANYGPNMTTFLLPSITYSESCRSTLNGISAAAGKLGAFIGSLVFVPMGEVWGDGVVMLFCGGLAILSFVLTLVCVCDVGDEVDSMDQVAESDEEFMENDDFVIR